MFKRTALLWLLAALTLAPLLSVSRLDVSTEPSQEVGMRVPPAWPTLEPQAHLNLLNAPEHRATGPELPFGLGAGVLMLVVLYCLSLDILFTPARKHLIAYRQLRLEGG